MKEIDRMMVLEMRGNGYVLKSLTDNFVFPSPALLKISRSLSNRSKHQF